MKDRVTVLREISVGDIFNAEDVAGPARTCLTTLVTNTKIIGRSITTQEVIEFNRTTGSATHFWHSKRYEYVINSVASLPADIYQIMLSIDRKFHDAACQSEGREGDGEIKNEGLSQEQIRGLLFIADFYKANPLAE